MAKMSAVNKNNKRIKLSNQFYKKRQKLKKIIMDKKLPLEEEIQKDTLFTLIRLQRQF